jgi:beta-mannanase
MPWITADWNLPRSYYPGDDYIDWIGFTIYGDMKINISANGKWKIPPSYEQFGLELSKKYHFIEEISTEKPYAILETGMVDYENSSKSAWLSDMFDTLLSPKYSNIKALNYWSDYSQDSKHVINYNIDSTVETLTTFQQLISNPRFISELRFRP